MSRKRRHLRPEEEELWKKVADTATPLFPERKTTKPGLQPTRPKLKPTPAIPRPPLSPFLIGQSAAAPAARLDISAVTPGQELARHPVRMDSKAFGKLRRGKLAPEARIDLHGMTLAQAHPVLVGFVLNAHGAGKRLVLVITGKGKTGSDDGPVPQRRGVLKHQVPQWLHSGPLRSVVLQVTQAHLKHGGSGAYYVYLKRRR